MTKQMLTPHFSREELQCKCGCGRMEILASFLDKLEDLRVAYGKPMTIGSGYRCPQHDQVVSNNGPDGPHTQAAVDVLVAGADAHLLLQHAMMIGFTGLGLRQKGDHSGRIIHLDDLPANTTPHHPRPRVWSY